MNNLIGNQQITSHQLAWLAGIWDGEGTLMIHYTNRNYYVGRATLTNTSVIMINEIVKILDDYGIKGHIFLEDRKVKNHKKCYHLTINKLLNVKKLIELMSPYLIVKKAHSELLLRFIESRLKYKKEIIRVEKGKIECIIQKGYTSEEQTLYQQLKQLNQVGVKEGISETT